MKSNIVALLVAGVCGMASLQAQAAVGYCVGPQTQSDGLSVSDMTLNSTNASDCYGVVTDAGPGGNVAGSFVDGLTWGVGFDSIGKVESNSGSASKTLFGLKFSISAIDVGETTGDWLLTIEDIDTEAGAGLPATLDFVAVLKGSSGAALYFWDDIIVDASNDGWFEMSFNASAGNGNGKGKGNGGTADNDAALSNFTLYVRQNEGGGSGEEVPEPGSLALLGLGLAGLAAVRRRRV